MTTPPLILHGRKRPSFLTREDESLLKTALAFTILRQKRQKTPNDNENKLIPFCRNLFEVTSSFDSLTYRDHNKTHLDNLMKLAATSIQSHYQTESVYMNITIPQERLQGVSLHLARSLKHCAEVEWVVPWIKDSFESCASIPAVCAVWNSVLQHDNDLVVAPLLLKGVGQLVQQAYDTSEDNDIMLMNLLLLLEAALQYYRNPNALETLQQAAPILTRPVTMQSLGHQNTLLRLSLQSLVSKLLGSSKKENYVSRN
mmetsp:Transcript_15727/g.22796  ORF Transcript_15727/g.22796 Transcript_15727/m.22796 type:complete len:257 (+) Transcript_15727:189-959(+)